MMLGPFLFNPEKYNNKVVGQIQVSLKRLSDDRIWTFDSRDKDVDGKYFNVKLRIRNSFCRHIPPRSA